MGIPIRSGEPASIIVGDTSKWTQSFSDFPASEGWSLSYFLVKSGTRIKIDADADGDAFAVTVTAATSAAWEPAEYHYQAVVSKGDEKQTVKTGKIKLQVGFGEQADGYDARSFAKKMVDTLEALLPVMASKGHASYSIGGRSMTYRSIDKLRKDLNAWRAEYFQKERRAGRMRSRIIKQRLS